MPENETIEEMHEAIREAGVKISSAVAARDAAERELKTALGKCGAISKRDVKIPEAKIQKERKSSSWFSVAGIIISLGASFTALVFSVFTPLAPVAGLSLPMLVMVVLALSFLCSIFFLFCGASLVALWLSVRQPAQQFQMPQGEAYDWFAKEQANTPIKETDPDKQFFQEQTEADLNTRLNELRESYRDPDYFSNDLDRD